LRKRRNLARCPNVLDQKLQWTRQEREDERKCFSQTFPVSCSTSACAMQTPDWTFNLCVTLSSLQKFFENTGCPWMLYLSLREHARDHLQCFNLYAILLSKKYRTVDIGTKILLAVWRNDAKGYSVRPCRIALSIASGLWISRPSGRSVAVSVQLRLPK
jgi:hypothetical protein